MDVGIRAGAALALLACAVGAQAAERPVPAASRDTAQPCPRQGPGFVRVPGSPTCVRVSGRAIGGIDLGDPGSTPVMAGQLSIDTRSESDFGPVRAFVRMGHGRP